MVRQKKDRLGEKRAENSAFVRQAKALWLDRKKPL